MTTITKVIIKLLINNVPQFVTRACGEQLFRIRNNIVLRGCYSLSDVHSSQHWNKKEKRLN